MAGSGGRSAWCAGGGAGLGGKLGEESSGEAKAASGVPRDRRVHPAFAHDRQGGAERRTELGKANGFMNCPKPMELWGEG